jgi:hypothetical protein
VSIENLASSNAVPALVNRHGDGVVTILGARLRAPAGTPDGACIINRGFMYARDVRAPGYAVAVENRSGTGEGARGPEVDEFVSHEPLCFPGGRPEALRLPVRPTPEVAQDPPEQWAGPHLFGASPGDGEDDTEAFQRAIDSGKTTVYLPNGTWTLGGELRVRGAVRRIVGCEAALKGKADIRIVDGTSPVVVIERIEVRYSKIVIRHESRRTLVLSSVRLWRDGAYEGTGGGDLFVEDVCGDPWIFNDQRVWARQLNPESSKHTMIAGRDSRVWILGLKTEGDGPVLEASGGAVEICGAFIYANTRRPKRALYVVRDADLSLTMGESSFRGHPFRELVVETRGGVRRTLTRDDVPRRGEGSAAALFGSRR